MPDIFNIISGYVILVLATTVNQVFILLGPGIILAFLMSFVAGNVEKFAFRVLGRKLYLVLFGWLGTMVHELGHATMCILFRHKITEVKWFDPDAKGGSLGHVYHSYHPNSVYQRIGNFFIGIGPVILGPIVIYFAARFLLGPQVVSSMPDVPINSAAFSSFGALLALTESTFTGALAVLSTIISLENLTNWKFYLFMGITFSVGSSITLSWPDIKGAFRGFAALVIFILMFNLIAVFFSDFINRYVILISASYSFFYGIIFFTMILNLLALALLLPFWLLKNILWA